MGEVFCFVAILATLGTVGFICRTALSKKVKDFHISVGIDGVKVDGSFYRE